MRQPSLDELRVHGRGRYLPLRAGLTHVIEEGQDDQAAILLVHGATVPAWEFDRLIPHLRAAGWRTIRFDLFGHGLSDRPAVRYDFSTCTLVELRLNTRAYWECLSEVLYIFCVEGGKVIQIRQPNRRANHLVHARAAFGQSCSNTLEQHARLYRDVAIDHVGLSI